MSLLVVGGSGQLGRHLRAELPHARFWERDALDLSVPSGIQQRLEAARPSAVVLAAAYTAVDKAESESDLAWRVNAEAPAQIARATRTLDIPLVHVSTDYVFDGRQPDGYEEQDGTSPLNVYGRTKLGGELAIQSLCSKYWILRTSWVFSEHGHNFVKTMLRLAGERDELRVVADQRGQPTYAGDLARCVASLLGAAGTVEAPPWGVMHVGAGPVVSWQGFARAIVEGAAQAGLLGRVPRVTGIATSDYRTPAKRPANSVLKTRAAWSRWNSEPFDWQRGLDRVLRALHVPQQAGTSP